MADFFGVLLLFFLVAGDRVPDVNEPHYWTKASHFWNPDFGQGDLFLASGNAHWLFYVTLGSLTMILPMTAAVWVGRGVLWLLLAWGWTWMMRGIWSSQGQACRYPWVGTLTAAGWLAGMFWGHLAGEWVLGGAEAKVAAYGFLFAAFGYFFRQRWTVGWLCLGVAGAFHIVVRGWGFISSIVLSYLLADCNRRGMSDWLSKHGKGAMLAMAGLLVGILPPLVADWGMPKELTTQAAYIQVYKRLGHHLAPTLMNPVRWQSHLELLLIAIGLVVAVARFSLPQRVAAQGSEVGSKTAKPLLFPGILWGVRWMLGLAIFGLSLALLGCLVDLGALQGFWTQESSARILKYYWFRWNDVAIPIWVATA